MPVFWPPSNCRFMLATVVFSVLRGWLTLRQVQERTPCFSSSLFLLPVASGLQSALLSALLAFLWLVKRYLFPSHKRPNVVRLLTKPQLLHEWLPVPFRRYITINFSCTRGDNCVILFPVWRRHHLVGASASVAVRRCKLSTPARCRVWNCTGRASRTAKFLITRIFRDLCTLPHFLSTVPCVDLKHGDVILCSFQ